MDTNLSIDLGQVARDLGIPRDQVQRTVELLDEGNTVPFITRYRKDQTGGLDEEQIRRVQADVRRQRQLAERKQTILKSIEAQGRLTPEVAGQIESARSLKHLEDLYLPFKPKKQTLATLARQRGLEPLAEEILTGAPAALDLQTRAAEFINADLKLGAVDDVLAGVGHLLAERFSERAELRSRLRRLLQRSGKLTSLRIEPEKRAEAAQAAAQQARLDAEETGENPAAAVAPDALDQQPLDALAHDPDAHDPDLDDTDAHDPEGLDDDLDDDDDATSEPDEPLESGSLEAGSLEAGATVESGEAVAPADAPGSLDAAAGSAPGSAPGSAAEAPAGEPVAPVAAAETPVEAPVEPEAGSTSAAEPPGPTAEALPGFSPAERPRVIIEPTAIPALGPGPLASRLTAKQQARAAARDAKKKKKQKMLESLYKDYYQYQEPLGKVPAHRILAINRGERAHVLRVRIEGDAAAMQREAEELLVPADHPHAEFLRACVRDALGRLVAPSLERELRREMTERAEQHAVEVFIRNLRKLLLQPPVHGRRVLAIDPGFRSGCKLAALDEFGNLVDHSTIHVIGSEQHRQLCRQRLVDMIKKLGVAAIAIGNGTACRETEQLIADILGNELADSDIAYVVVNEAGASVYSTSPIGREELPKYDATVRGAVSIGRRLLDPLSELVKINPANIGVGLYQHDLKAKHLRDSLDEVVESCVNYVGVDVNTASPALLRYVSGLNQLTARRLYEHRLKQGPFRDREQFRSVAGFGEATFVQAAGFLKIRGGVNPLDATSIHPESYQIATQVLAKLDSDLGDLAQEIGVPPLAEHVPEGDAASNASADSSFSIDVAAPAAEAPVAEAPAAEAPVAETPAAETPVADAPTADPVASESPSTDASEPAEQPVETAGAPAAEPAVEQAPVEPAQAVSTEPAREPLARRIEKVDLNGLAQELSVGTHLLGDILSALARPLRDPREDLPPPIFRRGIVKLEDLAAGMELAGTVLNVVDFGVFVDIGLSDSALIHISRLADRFVRDPHEVVGVGDVLKVWVVDVDKQRRRVSLTAIAPGSERPRHERPARPEAREARPPRQAQQGQRPPQGQRPGGQRGGQQGQQGGPRGGQRAGGGRPSGAPPVQGGGGRGAGPRPVGPPPKPKPPKPVPPITKGMIDGKEPMRAFSDLLQFYKKKKDEPEADGPK